jgi:hypothetical protein
VRLADGPQFGRAGRASRLSARYRNDTETQFIAVEAINFSICPTEPIASNGGLGRKRRLWSLHNRSYQTQFRQRLLFCDQWMGARTRMNKGLKWKASEKIRDQIP